MHHENIICGMFVGNTTLFVCVINSIASFSMVLGIRQKVVRCLEIGKSATNSQFRRIQHLQLRNGLRSLLKTQ